MSLAQLVVTELSSLLNLQIHFLGCSTDGIRGFNTILSRIPSIRVFLCQKILGKHFEDHMSSKHRINVKAENCRLILEFMSQTMEFLPALSILPAQRGIKCEVCLKLFVRLTKF